MNPTRFLNPDALLDAVGQDLGASAWLTLDQERINLFADATGDHQWIHVDAERAANEGPFGGTIAHGFLTMSLCALFLPQLMDVEEMSMGINYGVNKVRFPAPVPSGARVRAKAEIVAADEVKGGVQAVIRLTVEIEGGTKPACVVDWVCRYLR